MIRPGYDRVPVVETFRTMYRGERFPFAVLPELLLADGAAELRARAETAGLEPFFVADRGRYHANQTLRDEPLFDELRQIAAAVVEAPLVVGAARWLRLERGDYSLIRGDQASRSEPARHLELTLDFSEAPSDQAEIVYSDGAESIVVPQWPGALALVDKPPTLYRYERYLTHQVQLAIYRLRLILRYP